MLRFLRMPKNRIREFTSYPPEQKFAVATADSMTMSIALRPADASVGQFDVTVTSLPPLTMTTTIRDVSAGSDQLDAPSDLVFI